MKVTEMQERLEALQNDLSIITETANAVQVSLSEGVIPAEKMSWALIGIIRSLDKAVEDAGKLVDESIKIRGVLEKL